MYIFTNGDSPLLWQTDIHNLVRIFMESTLVFNQHLLFLFTVIVLFVVWFIYSMDSKTVKNKASSLGEDTLKKNKQKTETALLKL